MTRNGTELHHHVAQLYPLCRSITGEGLRATLRDIGTRIPLRLTEVPTGTSVLDWEVPPEWNVRAAFVAAPDGRRVIDFARHNLHLVQYSEPVDRVVPRAELDAHLHSLPDQPTLIPYRTSYYVRTWGFCLAHRDRLALTEDAYHVRIDSTLAPGSLTYGECVLPGESAAEVLFSTHCCHPSLANDNLASIAVAVALAQDLAARPRRRFTYRFLFAPGTIGAICWLAANRDAAARIRHGLVLTCLGDPAAPTYKQSRRGHPAIQPDRLRRTAIRLARLRSSRRLPDALARRHISRIPHVGRQSGFRAAGGAGRLAPRAARHRRSDRARRTLAQHRPLRRTAARPPRPL
jgi:aminopeptidase-like protein